MKKITLYALVIFCCHNQINAQTPSAVYNKQDSAALYQPKSDIITTSNAEAALLKPTVFNTARFLRMEQPLLTVGGVGYGVDVPGLIYTFSLTKNTVIQISETVTFSTYNIDLLGENVITSVRNSIFIDKERFACFSTEGLGPVTNSGGTVLAQLGPGVHTIKIHVGIKEEAAIASIYGYEKDRGNKTFMSLLFFEQ